MENIILKIFFARGCNEKRSGKRTDDPRTNQLGLESGGFFSYVKLHVSTIASTKCKNFAFFLIAREISRGGIVLSKHI